MVETDPPGRVVREGPAPGSVVIGRVIREAPAPGSVVIGRVIRESPEPGSVVVGRTVHEPEPQAPTVRRSPARRRNGCD
jgi:hypothetical protein